LYLFLNLILSEVFPGYYSCCRQE